MPQGYTVYVICELKVISELEKLKIGNCKELFRGNDVDSFTKEISLKLCEKL